MIKCELFEDNESCIKIVKAPILTPRTKHAALECHHFRSHIEDSSISIGAIRTGKQNADMLMKPAGEPQFSYLRKSTTDIDLARDCWELKQNSIVFPALLLTSRVFSVMQSHFITYDRVFSTCLSYKHCY